MGLKIILTGTTGMVGEGVLLECLENDQVSEVLSISRRPYAISHPKYSELLLSDFMQIDAHRDRLRGFDACFYCAGVSSIGMSEADYTHITLTTTLRFAQVLAKLNPEMVFDFVTGALTDSSEQGRSMWARVKGKTENELMKLPFRGQYNFRPGLMTPVKGQKNVKGIFKPFIAILPFFMPKKTLSLHEVGRAMIRTVTEGYSKQVLEVPDIKVLGV
ncbi:NAD-dependent epimerase/dehydratase family protein [Algoriphagus sp. H41]|uniref:NAD-dependent epimerase/dehydratase family protein n=2 Tax=Algoriphagus oliviformis TaxID=2811231 RepID=A0ABS3C237_9BACT|nr:NAD-dependent epimerase/dehydratase family protein [Algoriphagus oliviformis]